MKPAEELLEKYNAGFATTEEKAVVESWYLNYKTPPSDLTPQELLYEVNIGLPQLRHKLVEKSTIKWRPRIAVAASLLLCVGIGLVLFKKEASKKSATIAKIESNEIFPGGNKAMLTLADGSKIALDSKENGNLAEEQGVKIIKQGNGYLTYIDHGGTATAVGINTLETPRGGQYQVQLPDGTKVWLNSISSLKYPSKFSEKERKIELTGEAYFEVAKKIANGKRIPFIVSTNQQQVEVLGTHFNIKAYANDEEVKTTLLEGSVRVAQNNLAKVLKPGEQAIAKSNTAISIKKVDVEEVIAWKNGYFVFEDADIESIMESLSRWYDIDVIFKGEITKQKFGGAFPRTSNINDLLKYLETYRNVNFKIEGRRVIVMP